MITLSLIGNLVIALLLIVLLWYILKALPFIAPWGHIIDICALILAVIVLIMAVTGRNPVNIVLYESLSLIV